MEPRSSASPPPPLQIAQPLRRRYLNRVFTILYSLVVLSVLYRHIHVLFHGDSFVTPLLLFIADAILAFMWLTSQAFRINPIFRKEFPENLSQYVSRKDYPPIDIFICTADPYREPPMIAVNTALSVMAYTYSPEKLSVYISDDGGSELTMFAFMEAAKFAKRWLQFCKENNISERNPDYFFNSGDGENMEIKRLYESMKVKVETAVNHRKVPEEYISDDDERRILYQFTVDGFSPQDHPTVIQVLLNSNKDKDEEGGPMPNLIYVAREKRRATPHNFKAGALNVLLRVSACITNSPIILTLDCDMFSNDPTTIERALIYLNTFTSSSLVRSNCGYVQFPQSFQNINKGDIYDGELKMAFHINAAGFDGLKGPDYFGTGCFFRRRAFFGGPSCYIKPEKVELNPDHIVGEYGDRTCIMLAQSFAGCEYENHTHWGSKIGFFYGSLVEDFYTGYRLHCEGWQSVLCDPERPAFLGDAPISLNDSLNQIKRWNIGLLEVAFSKFSPLTFGVNFLGFCMGLGYAYYAFSPLRSIPITIYAFYPSLSLLKGISFFPKINDMWLLAYLFIFVGAYAQECIEFLSRKGTIERWWSSQRIWLVQSLSSHLFGSIEYLSKRIGISNHGFNVTSKVLDDEQRKRYDRGVFEFGVHSIMFVPLVGAAILNLVAFIWGLVLILNKTSSCDGGGFFVQMTIVGFGVVNSIPFYEAMVYRRDEGRIPLKTTLHALVMIGFLYGLACIFL